MPTPRIPMRTITEVLRLKYNAGLSHEKIARAYGLSKGVVSKYVSLAQVAGISWPLPDGTDEAALEAQLFPAKTPPLRFSAPDYFQVHQALKRKGVTLQLLWAEYVEVHGDKAYRYSQFCQYYRTWRGRQRRSMRQVHRAGEKLFIDYCGPTVPIISQATGEVRHAQVFVAVLGASSPVCQPESIHRLSELSSLSEPEVQEPVSCLNRQPSCPTIRSRRIPSSRSAHVVSSRPSTSCASWLKPMPAGMANSASCCAAKSCTAAS